MRRWIGIMAALLLAVLLPGIARAEPPGFADAARVSEVELADVRGGQAPFAVLTRGGTALLLDMHARDGFRQTGSVARIEMDVWWGSTGAELIAANVRAARS